MKVYSAIPNIFCRNILHNAALAVMIVPILSGSPILAQTAPLTLDPAKQGKTTPLPPQKTTPAQPKKLEPVAGVPAPACAPFTQLSTGEVVQKANSYLNSVTTMIADIQQFSTDGRRFKGKLYVMRPGKVRFDFESPSQPEVVSDGDTVLTWKKNLGPSAKNVYSIGQTPLKFLLKDKLDLNQDSKVLRGNRDCDQVSLTFEDKSTIAGTTQIRLQFAADTMALRQWVITDRNGNETVVQLSNIDTSRRPDPKLFKIDTTRETNTNGGN